jgi:hypothetical protein
MNSFYGGKQGKSFIIAYTYSTIAEMVESFGKNNINCPVNFDEYALINTINKNSPENGQIFKRGYDYNSDRTIISYRPIEGHPNPYEEFEIEANGAIYIGTIVGPAGRAPIFNFGNYSDVQNICQIRDKTFEDLEITYKNDIKRSDVIKVLNSKTQVNVDENGEPVIDSETGKPLIIFNMEELIDDFYTLRLTTSKNDKVVHYYCYDRRYGLNNQDSVGWYSIDNAPTTGEDKFRPYENLIPGITYAYADEGLLYDTDSTGARHIALGENEFTKTPYQDTIDWTYCTVRNENLEDSTAYVGFRFAAPIVEFETETVNPYYNRSDIINDINNKTNNFTNLNLITRMTRDYDEDGNLTGLKEASQSDIEQHPFYSLWKINIPKGIKGESIKNIYLVDAAQEHNIKTFILDENGNLTYNDIGEIQVADYVEDISTPEGMSEEDIESSKEKWVIVFDYVCYDRIPEGESHTIYLGDFNKLNGIKLEHHGELAFDYSHNNTERTPKEEWIHWIDKVIFNNDGTITVTFNDNTWNVESAENQDAIINGVLTKPQLINWITNMGFANDGTIDVTFNNNNLFNGKLTKSQLINWITDVEFADNGTVNVTFNNNNLFNGKLTRENLITWMTKFSLDEDNGELIVEFNNNRLIPNVKKTLQWVKDITIDNEGTITTDYTNQANREQKNLIQWINDMSFTDDGTVIVNFNHNNLNTTQITNGVLTKTHLFHWIDDMEFKNDGTVIVKFNNASLNSESGQVKNGELNLSQLITWMTNFSLNTETGQLIVEFNNNKLIPNVNTTLQWVKDIAISTDGTVTTDYTNKADKKQDKLIQWIDNIKINNGANENQKLSIKYNNKDNYIDIGSPLNYVVRMAVNPDNGNLLTLYSDPQKHDNDQEYDGITGWSTIGNLKYSTSLSKADYNNISASERVKDLIVGAVCYRTEEIN